jgi:hypothetical protein
LPKDEQILARRLRSLIFEAEPRIQEKLSYGVPYFYRNRRIVFLWPSSACNGPKDAKIILGFCYGNLLSNEQHVLIGESRKQVYILKFSALADIDEKVVSEICAKQYLLTSNSQKIKKHREPAVSSFRQVKT